jgi:TorA maturation chaperone TorD
METEFVRRERAMNEKEPWCVTDEAAMREMLDDEDFRAAFAGAMRLLGTIFLLRPIHGEALEAVQALEVMDLRADWPFGTEDQLDQAQGLLRAGADEDLYKRDLEFMRLFRGTGTRKAAPYGSVYMDHDRVLFGWTWNALRDWMRSNGVTTLYQEREPEDQIGRMMLLAAELSDSRPDLLPEFLGDHFLPWADHFLELFQADTQSFTYTGAAVLARLTLDDVAHLLAVQPARRRFF